MPRSPNWPLLEDRLHRDPGGRGLAAYRRHGRPLDAGNFRAAAEELASRAAAVAVVTGFCVRCDDGCITAETDGPPGALFLARALRHCGVQSVFVTDRFAAPLLAAGCTHWGLPVESIREMPLELSDAAAASWAEEFLATPFGERLTHLIAIERCGPSHTLASIVAQHRAGAAPLAEFESAVPPASRDVYHNMRGDSIHAATAKTHALFEAAATRHPRVVTIGIGDGGNELGMGSFLWEDVVRAVGGAAALRIACRIAVDYPLVAGVSNWAGYALGLALCQLRAASVPEEWDAADLQRLMESLVRGGAVDGVTRRREATVDGLPLEAYLRHYDALRAAATD